MQDNDLDDARTRQARYQSLVMEGKIMADISETSSRIFAPYSIICNRIPKSSSYYLMQRRLNAKEIATRRVVDFFIGFFMAGSFIVISSILWKTYSVSYMYLLDNLGPLFIAFVFICIITYGYFQRRYGDYVRYKLYTDTAFFTKAMQTPGAIRLFWTAQDIQLPEKYTLEYFPLISGKIQDESINFILLSPSTLRDLLRKDEEVITQFKEASIKGYLFSTTTFNE
ncbi:MAG: hypothetical protein RI911_316, partial [Candidatus Parcubacteria bacterium]